MPDSADSLIRRMEWWPELGVSLGILVGVVGGFVQGEGIVDLSTAAVVLTLLLAAVVVRRIIKRAFFDRHMEHYLASVWAASVVLFFLGMSLTQDVVATGTWSWPLFDLAAGLVIGGGVYRVLFATHRRAIVPLERSSTRRQGLMRTAMCLRQWAMLGLWPARKRWSN